MMLTADGLQKRYGDHLAVERFDLSLGPGTIVGLVGNNGAGKSTVLKMLCGLLEPSEGTATKDGVPTSRPAARRSLGFVPEDSPLYEELTPVQLMDFFARLYGVPAAGRQDAILRLLERMRLDEEHWHRPCGVLSKGSARKVALARALLHGPDVLILDEPSSGLDPATRSELEAVLLAERARGVAVLLSAHDMHQVERLCDEVVLMHRGRVAARGTLTELQGSWGDQRFRVAADVPFTGAVRREGLHERTIEDLDTLWAVLDELRQAHARHIEFATKRPGLREILARLEEP